VLKGKRIVILVAFEEVAKEKKNETEIKYREILIFRDKLAPRN